MVRAKTATGKPCATARARWAFVLLRLSSRMALFGTPGREKPGNPRPSPSAVLCSGPGPGRLAGRHALERAINEMICSRPDAQRLKLADGGRMEIGNPTTNTLPARMICTDRVPVAKRKKYSSFPSPHREFHRSAHAICRPKSKTLPTTPSSPPRCQRSLCLFTSPNGCPRNPMPAPENVHLSLSSRASQARAYDHHVSAVRGDMPRTPAHWASVKPPK